MFRKLSSALYQVTHKQLLATFKNTKSITLKNNISNINRGGITQSFLRYEAPLRATANKKITIVGSQESSLVTALNCLARDLCKQICIMDCQALKENTNTDLHTKLLINKNLHITATRYFQDTKDSDLIILTKDIKGCKGCDKSFKDNLEQYTNVMKNLIPNLLKYSPNTIFLIDTEQADIVTYVAWKLSRLPKNRVLSPTQINEYIKEPLNSNCQQSANSYCTADVAAKIIENYQRILLSTLPPAPPTEEKQPDEKNLTDEINSHLTNSLQNISEPDLICNRKIII